MKHSRNFCDKRIFRIVFLLSRVRSISFQRIIQLIQLLVFSLIFKPTEIELAERAATKDALKAAMKNA